MEQQLYDIYGIWHQPFWQTRSFYITLALLCALLCVLIIFLIIKLVRMKKSSRMLPPWESALHALQTLKQEKITNAEQGKQIYFQLTEILKRYLQARYGFDLMGKTDEEMITYLHGQSQAAQFLPSLKSICEGAVLIKFANVATAQEQLDKDIALSFLIVQQTVPNEERK